MDLIPEIIAQGDRFGELVSNSEIWSILNRSITMNNKVNIENINLAERIHLGVQKALRKLAEESAAKGESLVIKVDGKIKEVPAEELLMNLPK